MNGPKIISFLGLSRCGEARELANRLKKLWRSESVLTDEPRHELADIRIYLEHLAEHLGFDLDEACKEKVERVRQRLAASQGAA